MLAGAWALNDVALRERLSRLFSMRALAMRRNDFAAMVAKAVIARVCYSSRARTTI